jgi:hypothetical protein
MERLQGRPQRFRKAQAVRLALHRFDAAEGMHVAVETGVGLGEALGHGNHAAGLEPGRFATSVLRRGNAAPPGPCRIHDIISSG